MSRYMDNRYGILRYTIESETRKEIVLANITLLYPDYAFLPYSFWEETEKENGNGL